MFEIGPSLREARMRRGLSSEDVQKAIRIRDRYLHALEEERWELLPGDAYVKGFLRTYAEFLGLDGNLYVDEYSSRFAHHDEPHFVPGAASPVETGRIGLMRPLLAIAAIVAVVAAVAAWQLHGSSGNRPPRAQSAGPATPTANPTRTHTTKPATTRHRTAPPRPTPTTAHAVLTAARGRVWLLVRSGSATGRVLYEGVLEQGQTLPVTLSPRVWFRVGAPWNLDVRVSGRLLSGLPAQPGNVVLSPAGLAPAA
jgi:cytoskeletal protein RodZ